MAMNKPSKASLQDIVKLSYGMSGKMNNVLSLSTNCVNCPRCIKRHNIENSICHYCYAMKQLEKPNYKNTNMIKAFNHNADVLTNRLLTDNETMAIAIEIVEACIKNGTDKFRIESFGDLHNETHAMNYVKICAAVDFVAFEKNYSVKIGFWTKNFDYLCNAFSKCDEFTQIAFRHSTSVVLSSVFVGIPMSEKVLDKVNNILGMNCKVFTVYKTDNGFINCGSRNCSSCGNCYTKNNETTYINELLK